MSRKILFKTVEVEVCKRKRERGVYCKCSQDKWRFIVKEQIEGGSVDGKLLREDIKGRQMLLKLT